MRFGANGQRTVTIGRVWAARYHGIMVSRYTDRSGQLDCLTMEERCLTKTGHKCDQLDAPRYMDEWKCGNVKVTTLLLFHPDVYLTLLFPQHR